MKVVQQLTCLNIRPAKCTGLLDRWAVEHDPGPMRYLVIIAPVRQKNKSHGLCHRHLIIKNKSLTRWTFSWLRTQHVRLRYGYRTKHHNKTHQITYKKVTNKFYPTQTCVSATTMRMRWPRTNDDVIGCNVGQGRYWTHLKVKNVMDVGSKLQRSGHVSTFEV